MADFEIHINKHKEFIESLNFDKLVALAGVPKLFYQYVTNENMVSLYMKRLHEEYCKKNNMTPATMVFSDNLITSDLSEIDVSDMDNPVLLFDISLMDTFLNERNENSKFYPLLLVYYCIHESRHLWQYQNIENLNTGRLTRVDNLNVASFYENLCANLFCEDEMFKVTQSSMEDSILKIVKIQESVILGKRNCPHDVDADNEVIKILDDIYNKTSNKTISEINAQFVLKFISDYKDGQWSIDKKLSECKKYGYADKRIINVLEEENKKFTMKKVFELKNTNYSSKDYILEFYPELNKRIDYLDKNINNIKIFLESNVKNIKLK